MSRRASKINSAVLTPDFFNSLYTCNPLTGEVFHKHAYKSKRAKKGSSAGCFNKSKGRHVINTTVNGKKYIVHRSRVLWTMVYGVIPDDLEVDHINSVKSDDRLSNLRLTTASRNNLNMNDKLQSNNTSGVRGVSYIKLKGRYPQWKAHFKVRGKLIQEYFLLKKDAVKCRKAMEKVYTQEVIYQEGR